MLDKKCPVCSSQIKYFTYIKRYFYCEKCKTKLALGGIFLWSHTVSGVIVLLLLVIASEVMPSLFPGNNIIAIMFWLFIYMIFIEPVFFLRIIKRK
jgi:hypothetical protein